MHHRGLERLWPYFVVGAELKDPFEFLMAPSTESNRRNSEADMLVKKDGRIMLAWTEFYTSEGATGQGANFRYALQRRRPKLER